MSSQNNKKFHILVTFDKIRISSHSLPEKDSFLYRICLPRQLIHKYVKERVSFQVRWCILKTFKSFKSWIWRPTGFQQLIKYMSYLIFWYCELCSEQRHTLLISYKCCYWPHNGVCCLSNWGAQQTKYIDIIVIIMKIYNNHSNQCGMYGRLLISYQLLITYDIYINWLISNLNYTKIQD